jgi:hypothetical protein
LYEAEKEASKGEASPENNENASPQEVKQAVPHRNAVGSQAPEWAGLGRKSGVMNWIGIAA